MCTQREEYGVIRGGKYYVKVEDTYGYMECGVKEIRDSDAGKRGHWVKPNDVTYGQK